MKYTCAQAAKCIRKLNEELAVARNREKKSCRFTAAVGEELSAARPEYDYDKEQQYQAEIESKIRRIKHAINRFNLETEVTEFGMTIDELLVYIPQLTERKRKLTQMASFLKKERTSNASYGSKIIEYTYTNYDIDDVKKSLDDVTDELARAQTVLDQLNTERMLDIDVSW